MALKFNPSRRDLLRALVLIVGCLAKFSSGSIFVFNVYSNAIKASFNYTQSEVLLLASMVNLGLGVGLPAGMVYDRFGPVITSFVGLISTSFGYLLIWSTFRARDFYSTRNSLMAFYFFIVGHGSLYTYMSALGTNVRNFLPRHRGKVIGLLDACFGGSPAIFVLVYSGFYVNGHVDDQENQNVAGFMLLFSIWFGIANALCVLFLRVYPPDEDVIENQIVNSTLEQSVESVPNYTSEKESPTVKGDNLPATRENESDLASSSKCGTLTEILKLFLDPKFEYLMWMHMFASAVGLAFVNNVTVVTKSVNLSEYDTAVTTIIPVSGIVARFSLGPISDYVKDKFPRTYILLITNIIFALSQLLCVFLADKAWAFILANVLSGVSIGCIWTFVPALISEFFGLKEFGRNWGIVILLAALAGIAIQETYGRIYEAFIKIPNSHDCYGLICIKWNFVMMTGLTFIAILLNIFLIQTDRGSAVGTCRCNGNSKSHKLETIQ